MSDSLSVSETQARSWGLYVSAVPASARQHPSRYRGSGFREPRLPYEGGRYHHPCLITCEMPKFRVVKELAQDFQAGIGIPEGKTHAVSRDTVFTWVPV